jgi:hypothetical protein
MRRIVVLLPCRSPSDRRAVERFRAAVHIGGRIGVVRVRIR